MAEVSPLRRRMIEDMTIGNLSPATQRTVGTEQSQSLTPAFGNSWPL
jgi:hypothetical protein